MTYIAMAEDHLLVRESIKDVLEISKIFKVIIETSNGKKLIDALNDAPVLPRICIIDINMPQMNGYDTIHHIRNTWPQIKILALSMYINDYSIIRIMKNGAHGYLPKDCDKEKLFQALNQIDKHGYYFWDGTFSEPCENSYKDITNLASQLLTSNEQVYLDLCCKDISNAEIARKMNKSPRTVEDYRNSLFKKFKVNNRLALALFAIKKGLVTLSED